MFQKPKKSIGAPHSSSSVHPLSTAAISAGSFNEAVLAAKKRVLLDKVKNPYFSSEQDHYRAIAEAIPHIVFTADPDGEVDYYNEQWHRYTSLSWEETLQQGDDSILHPDDRQRCQEKWDNAVKTGELYEIEYRLRRASDGMYRWHLGRAVPVRNSEGEIIKWFGTATDIHEQKMAETTLRMINEELEDRVMERTSDLHALNEELKKEIGERKKIEDLQRADLQRMKNTVNNLPIAAVALNEDFKVLHTNDKFCALFHLPVSATALLGRHAQDVFEQCKESLVQPEDLKNLFQVTLATKKTQLNQEIHFKDGRIVSSDSIPIVEKGTYHGHLLLFRDITQEKRIDTAKSEFMSLASHQLRTPLTAIRWSLGRLTREIGGEAAPSAKGLLDAAKSAALHMAKTIDLMLAISRIEAGKIKIDRKMVHIAPLIEEVQKEIQEEYNRKQQHLRLVCDPSHACFVDPNLLKEVLQNLLSNSMKYTPEGGSISIEVSRGQDRLRITLADTGYGIPKDQQEKIFTKFFRADNVLALNTDGNGLGLYLTYRLVHMLKGQITFVSEEKHGTTFTILLPLSLESLSA